MARLNEGDVAALRFLPEVLRRAGYVDTFAVHGALHVRFDRVEQHLGAVPEPLRTLVRLFMLGAPVAAAAARTALPTELCAALLRLGVLVEADGQLSTAGLSLVPLLGQLAFVPRQTGTTLLEEEFVLAARVTPPPGARCLSLCAAHGLAALRCATLASRVVAVEINPILVGCIELTFALNSLEDRAQVREGDLYAALAADERFDYAVAETPVMPFPPALVSPAAAADDDGAAVFRRVLGELPRVLAPDGWAQILASSVGDETGPHLAAELARRAGELGLRIVTTVPARIPLDPRSELFELLASGSAAAYNLDEGDVRERLRTNFATRNVKYLYSMVLTLHPASDRHAPRSTRMAHFVPSGGFWFR
ncbi:MAG: hypothetical protein KF773_13140 [Deltaproteobacteria bacterium]|nr:hypothetical protein [Deltaproteobacteria bacterium]MCW5805379.1 hypothetical protein [Deltaproteobacteria bacterium]